MDTKGKVETTNQTPTVKKRPRSSKVASPKTAKPARLASRSSNAQSGKLVCRYCGSDDLAPSFKKRRDARCRACFKKRYGSAQRKKAAKRTLKAKAAR